MDWTEGEARLATLERDVTRRQRLARENRTLARGDDQVTAVERGPRLWRWLGRRRWRGLPVLAEPFPVVGDPRANPPRVA